MASRAIKVFAPSRLLDAGAVNDVLSSALEPVLRDIRSSGAPTPEIRDEDWTDSQEVASAMLWSSDGSSTGVRVELAAPEHDRVMQVTDQVQEWVIHELWGHAPTNWPPCPNHPDSHPLAASTREIRVVWVCPSDGTPFAPVGSLQ
jgi:hypothetical protein